MKKGDEPVIVEQVFSANMHTVWEAITSIDQMRQWYFDNVPSFKPEVGFATQFSVRSQDREFRHVWKVTEVVPGRKLAYTWKFDGYPGDSFVSFELIKQAKATKLKLTATVTEDFPEGIPEFTRESCMAGWEYFIKQSLKGFLEKQ